jgi:hypothetical protein
MTELKTPVEDMSASERARASEITVRGLDERPSARREGIEDKMRRLERKATVLRSRLMRTIDVLDARRRQVRVVGQRAKSAASYLGLGLLGATVLVGAGIYLIGRSFTARPRRSFPYRLSNAVDGLRPVRAPSLGKRLVERVALTIASIIAAEIAKRGSRNVLDGRSFAFGRRYEPSVE